MFSIAIPHDVLFEAPDEASKIRKLGYIARAAAVFKVEKIIIYLYGRTNWDDVDLMKKIFEYLATPPYLRKRVYKLDSKLRLAGLLPPLKIPSHVVDPEPRVGEIREGIVERWDGYYSIVYIGGGKYAKVPRPHPVGSRLLVRIEAPTARPDTYRASIYRGPPPTYWGYKVEVRQIDELFRGFDTVVLTGKEGRSVCQTRLKTSGEVLVVFGGPRRGVDEILQEAGVKPPAELINFVPNQGTETIRTEEAIFIVLAVLNYLNNCKPL